MRDWIIAGVLLFAVLFWTESRAADEFLVYQYTPDVRIVLSPVKCNANGETHRAVAQRIDRQYIPGCWHLKDNMVHIDWLRGDFSEFPLELFKARSDE